MPCKRRLGEGELVFVHPSAHDLDYWDGALDFAQCSVKSVQRAVEKVSQIKYKSQSVFKLFAFVCVELSYFSFVVMGTV